MNKFRKNNSHINLIGEENLLQVLQNQKPVIFISGHFANFELMSMEITKHNISLATIYNCLNKFVNVGLLKQIDQQGEVTIFDTNVSHHHHFLNQNTGELTDIEPDEISFSKFPEIPKGFQNDGVEVLIKIRD